MSIRLIHKMSKWGISGLWILLLVNCNLNLGGNHSYSQSLSLRNSKKNVHMNFSGNSPLLEGLLQQHPSYFEELIRRKDEMNIQIIYSQIDRDEKQQPIITHHTFNLNQDKYFYPASTVKLPTAILALQKLNELKVNHLDRNSTMITQASYSGQTPVFNDPMIANGRPSISNYIKKILLVSDNDAFNRLYEFLGQEYINTEMHKRGFSKTEIRHRLERSLTEDENRHTNPINFYDNSGKKIYGQEMKFYTGPYAGRKDYIGKSYMKGDAKVDGPMDFSKKNRLVLVDLHQIIQSVIFPESMPVSQRFNLSKEDLQFLRNYMSMLPPQSDIGAYKTNDYWNAYCKFLLWGSEKNIQPSTIKIYNKVGDAYGFLIDAAYIIDTEKKIEFMLSAVIYCNSDGVLNDSKYDYDTIGLPFMKHLGEVIYDYECNRFRKVKPIFEDFLNTP